MAAVIKNDIPQEAAFMSEFWKLVKQFWIPEERDSYWEELVAATDRLHKRFPSEFCKRLLLAYLSCQEDKFESGKKQEVNHDD